MLFTGVIGVKIRSHSSRVRPEPVSATSMTIFPSSRRLRRVSVPPFWHGIHCIEHQIRKGAMQQLRVGGNRVESLLQLKLALYRLASRRLQLRLKQLR